MTIEDVLGKRLVFSTINQLLNFIKQVDIHFFITEDSEIENIITTQGYGVTIARNLGGKLILQWAGKAARDTIRLDTALELLAPPKPVDGVDILVLFLKHYRKLSKFKRCIKPIVEGHMAYTITTYHKIDHLLTLCFAYGGAEGGLNWYALARKLETMVQELNIPPLTETEITKLYKLIG